MLRLIFWVIVAVLFLSFFGISLQGLIEDPQTQRNFAFVLELLEQGWESIWSLLVGFIDALLRLIPGYPFS